MEKNGVILIIDYVFNYASVFSEGAAQVQLNSEHYAYIDKYGKIIQEAHNIGGDCHNGMVLTYENMYMCMSTGNYILEDFARIGQMSPCPFSEGLAVFSVYNSSINDKDDSQEQYYNYKNWEYYYVDTIGNFVLGPYEAAASFHEGLAVVLDKGHVYCIKKDGSKAFELNIAEKYQYEITNMMFSDGLIYYIDENGKYGFVDYYGNVVIEAKYDWVARNFENGVAVCMNEGKYEFINKNGTTIFDTDMFEIRYDTDFWWWREE